MTESWSGRGQGGLGGALERLGVGDSGGKGARGQGGYHVMHTCKTPAFISLDANPVSPTVIFSSLISRFHQSQRHISPLYDFMGLALRRRGVPASVPCTVTMTEHGSPLPAAVFSTVDPRAKSLTRPVAACRIKSAHGHILPKLRY